MGREFFLPPNLQSKEQDHVLHSLMISYEGDKGEIKSETRE